MIEWWQNLGDRERSLLGIGGVLLALMLLYVMVLEPLQAKVASINTLRTASSATLQRMNVIAEQAATLRAQQIESGTLPDDLSLQRAVDESAQAASLRDKISSLTQDSAISVKMMMQGTPLTQSLMWLLTLRQQYGIRISELEATRGDAAGTANLSVTLTR
jgi:general secretion pathway protein M